MDMDIEESLRRALRAEEPAPDFTGRVLARVARSQVQAAQPLARRRSRWQLPLALAASVVVAVAGLGIVQQQRESQRLQAARQLALALEITSSQLNQVQQKLIHTPNQENGI
jgi:hypothetical protein